MPHIVIKVSNNVLEELHAETLLPKLHADLAMRETVGEEHIKTYLIALQECVVGTDGTLNRMVHVILKLLPGREVSLKKEMLEGLRRILLAELNDCSLTLEIQELEAETYCK